jgi:Fe-S-cluster-containing dehydrogenase component
MLIDLDRCTRCDKCVEACVATHSKPWWRGLPLLGNLVHGPTDGRSRLFLEGPRFQISVGGQAKNYLVPSTCRMCQDPVCLVGCPVGSIHKGENGQIVIEDWCIGCSRCATQCPYGSIQMHAVGILPRGVHGWRSRRGGGAWIPQKTPVLNTRELRRHYAGPASIRFRHALTLTAETLRGSKSFQVHLQTVTVDPRLHLNGRKVKLTPVKGQGPGGMKWTHEAMLVADGTPVPANLTPGEAAPQALLKAGRNVLTAHVKPAGNDGDVLFDLSIYAVATPVLAASLGEDVNQEVVMNTAVVCDMCSEQAGQRPACVNACPHEAAIRVNATTFFPVPST